jgi:PLP dependent protein
MTSSIAHNIDTIRQGLPDSVRLMAVTKQVSVAAMREAYAMGIRDFGESRIQEAEKKQQELSDLTDLCWHLIGHLQSNKVRKAIAIFDWIHSIDSLKLAQQLDAVLAEGIRQRSSKLKVCLQVKILPDPDKYGWNVSELMADLPAIDRTQHLDICGLMAIPPLGLNIPETIACFDGARDLRDRIRQQSWEHIDLSELSMGMSGDYQQAIPCGSTIVRLGSIIFGERVISS